MNIQYFFLFVVRRIYLFFYLLRKQFIRMFFSSLGLLLSLILIFSILGILRPAKKFIVDQFEKSIPVDTIVVKAPVEQGKTTSLISLLRKKKDITMGITAGKVALINQWDEVASVSQTQVLQKSISGKFDHPVLSRLGITFDLLVQGVSRDLVSGNLKCLKNFTPTFEISPEGEKMSVIPLLLPESFAEMAYAYTVMNGLPAVTKTNMIGLRLILNINNTSNIRDRSDEEFVGLVCGFVPQNVVSVAGAPLSWVKKMHLQDQQFRAAASYDKLFIHVKSSDKADLVISRLKDMGLVILSGGETTYSKINKWLNRLDYLLWSFVAILLLISAISLSNSFMILTTQKRYEFGLYLVFGASPIFLWLLIFIEGAFWGAFHSMLAYFIAENFSVFLQHSMQSIPWINSLFNNKMTFDFSISFSEKWYLITGSVIFGGVSSLIPALFMSGMKTLTLVKKD